MDKNTSRTLLIGIFVLATILFIAGGALLYSSITNSSTPASTATAVAVLPELNIETSVAQTVAAISQEQTAVAPPTNTLPPVNTLAPATFTPLPTNPPTETPIPTDTPVPTDVPTNTPVPFIPTNTPVPFIPTNTPAPTAVPPTNTPSGPQAGNQRGLVASHFVLQDWRTNPVVNGEIWYEWTVSNTSGAGVPYSTIGIMPRKDGTDRVQWYQNNWGGNNDVMPPEGLSWPSWMSLPEAGNYTLRVVVCFDGFQTCLSGNGTFHTLSNEIPINIR